MLEALETYIAGNPYLQLQHSEYKTLCESKNYTTPTREVTEKLIEENTKLLEYFNVNPESVIPSDLEEAINSMLGIYPKKNYTVNKKKLQESLAELLNEELKELNEGEREQLSLYQSNKRSLNSYIKLIKENAEGLDKKSKAMISACIKTITQDLSNKNNISKLFTLKEAVDAELMGRPEMEIQSDLNNEYIHNIKAFMQNQDANVRIDLTFEFSVPFQSGDLQGRKQKVDELASKEIVNKISDTIDLARWNFNSIGKFHCVVIPETNTLQEDKVTYLIKIICSLTTADQGPQVTQDEVNKLLKGISQELIGKFVDSLN